MSAPALVRVGSRAYLTVESRAEDGEDLRFLVYVAKARHNFGRTDFLVQPCAGEGETWVQEHRLEGV